MLSDVSKEEDKTLFLYCEKCGAEVSDWDSIILKKWFNVGGEFCVTFLCEPCAIDEKVYIGRD